MKKNFTLIALIAVVFTTSNLFSQNNFWTFPEQSWIPGSGIQLLPTSTSGYSGDPAEYVHAGIMDPYGNIIFSVVDDRVYDKHGVDVGYIDANINTVIAGSSDALIVPQPGSCERFYIFQSGIQGGFPDGLPYYSVYNQADHYLEYLNGSYTAKEIEGNLIEEWYEGTTHQYRGVHFAATKERPDSARWVFIANNKDLYRINLTCTGLESTDWKYSFSPTGSTDQGWRSEMEIYEDTAANRIRVAIPYQHSTSSGYTKVALFDLDSASGNIISGSRNDIELPNNWDGGASYIHGIEFSPDGKLLYIMHEKTSTFTSPLSYYNIATQTLTDLAYSNILNFKNSQLEIAGDSANYTLWMASDHYLGGLFDPDNPASPPSPSNWNSSAVPLNNYPTNLGGNNPTSLSDIKHIVPAQIDYEDYVEGIFFATCDCCEKYAYAGETKDTTFIATLNQTWSYGLGNNPWDAVTGDTIYIRDYLLIPAGKSVTISGMYFKFGPDARAIVQRKVGALNAASLTLTNGTVFTADFRCAKRKYHCNDPEARCNELEFWQGVRVEGDATDLTQSTTKQARFTMLNNSMIEYARIGVLAGSETLSNYGGGIVSIKDSRIKDNETGIKFDPYTRLSGSTELFNKSYIYRNNFTTTDEWVFQGVPLNFVDVNQSSGLNIQGNAFANTNSLAIFHYTQKGTGIKTTNSRINATWACGATPSPCSSPVYDVFPNKFTNLAYGIYGMNSAKNVRTLTCNYGLFEDNWYGIHVSNFINPIILDNTFKLPSNLPTATIGLFLNVSTGYAVQNNNFSTNGSGSTIGNYGVYISNSGSGANEIYRNQFTKLMIGGYALGVNTDINNPPNGYANGLRWFCNTFDIPISIADIALSGSMSDEQGNCSRPANNLFSQSNTLYPSHKGLLSYPTSIEYIDYKYSSNTGTYPRLKPDHYSGEFGPPYYYQLGTCSTPYNPESSCQVDLSGAPILPGIDMGFASNESNASNDLMDYATLSEKVANYSSQLAMMENQDQSEDAMSELAQLKYEYNKLWQGAVRQYQADTTGMISPDQMQALLIEYQPTEVSRFASIVLPQDEQNWIDEDNLSQESAFAGGPLPSMTENGLPLEIPEWFESDFFASASNTSALNALYISEGAIYHAYIADVATTESDWNGSLYGNSGSTNNSQLIVQPNPFNETVQFNLTNFEMEGSQNRLEFYDITGVQVYSVQLSADQTQIEIDGNNLPEGMILYTLYINDVPVENGKIVRVN